MISQAEKAVLFQKLHERNKPFVVGNPWDAGSARILTSLKYEALSTTSAGLAFSLGRKDGTGAVSRAEALSNARCIVEATDLPVAADLENGYGHRPEDAAETIRLAAEAGLVGGSIEDATGTGTDPIYDFDHAVERVAAAAQAARALPFPFMFVARAENYLHGRPDLDDTIRRLQAYEKAGADVLYAPGLTSAEDIRTACSSVTKPVNVLMGLKGANLLTVSELGELGARRISIGSGFSRAALTAFLHAAREVIDEGTFTFADDAMYISELMTMFR
ncbi:isocitrate lyase/PEP mutase family protein [Occallatibacter savannae]|uniref:isocitrate lyase/PEP mutase family protein n=1 Tax=Occallatibacter savannae TaxID=1002691 RepID=UPI000D6879CE|nr:isocitrate lyase/phosphoenolpyruvate mutase family protein [Occallatibacter savannae]